MDQNLLVELGKSGSAAVIIGAIVWWSLRDQGKILRSMDLRLAKLLEHIRRTSPTPPLGVPTFKRKRTHHDSDMETGEGKPLLPRTVTDEDVDP